MWVRIPTLLGKVRGKSEEETEYTSKGFHPGFETHGKRRKIRVSQQIRCGREDSSQWQNQKQAKIPRKFCVCVVWYWGILPVKVRQSCSRHFNVITAQKYEYSKPEQRHDVKYDRHLHGPCVRKMAFHIKTQHEMITKGILALNLLWFLDCFGKEMNSQWYYMNLKCYPFRPTDTVSIDIHQSWFQTLPQGLLSLL